MTRRDSHGGLRGDLESVGKGMTYCLHFVLLLEEDFTLSLSPEHSCVTDWTALSRFPVTGPALLLALSDRSREAKPPAPPTHTAEVVVSSNSQPANYPKISFIARKVSYLIQGPTKTKPKTISFSSQTLDYKFTLFLFFRYENKTKPPTGYNWL